MRRGGALQQMVYVLALQCADIALRSQRRAASLFAQASQGGCGVSVAQQRLTQLVATQPKTRGLPLPAIERLRCVDAGCEKERAPVTQLCLVELTCLRIDAGPK